MPEAINAAHSSPDTRFGGACTRMRDPSTMRAVATAARNSVISASGVPRIAVSGLARKLCTITS